MKGLAWEPAQCLNQAKNIPAVLPSFPFKIRGKSGKGFMS